VSRTNTETKKSGFATAGLVTGIVGISLSFIPILNNASFVLGILAVIFGIIPLVKKASKGKAIAALVLGVLSIVITLSLQSSWSKTLDETSKKLDDITGENTEEILKKVDVNIGTLEVVTSEYGYSDTKLVVKVTNKSGEKKSFDITIEAVDADGTRLDTDELYANDLASGQSQSFNLFTYISEDKLEAMKTATFKIAKASMY
jgi:uncharacterized membrane protein (UPF0136 family)